tara:strand:- start:2542 stop:2790 length:249 start_codon:yes stop_codon:yes gene_type:complete
VLQNLLGSEALSGLLDEQSADKVLGILRHIIPTRIIEVILHIHDLLEKSRGIVGIEWRIAAQSEQQNRKLSTRNAHAQERKK